MCRRCRFHNATAISAMPMGMPGCPEFAACTASIASARMALASNVVSAIGRAALADAGVGTVKGAIMARWEHVMTRAGARVKRCCTALNYRLGTQFGQ